MTPVVPDFMLSKYYDIEHGCMKPDAPDELKKAYMDYWNDGRAEEDLKDDYPDMKHPYQYWDGSIKDGDKKYGT